MTLNSFASTEVSTEVLLEHLLHAFGRVNEPSVDESVENFRRGLDDLLLLLGERRCRQLHSCKLISRSTCLHIQVQDEIQGVVVVRDLVTSESFSYRSWRTYSMVEASQVEVVVHELLLDLAEEAKMT